MPTSSASAPFFQIQLDGGLLRAQRALAGARAVLAALVAAAYFLPWHVVHRTDSGGIGGAFAPHAYQAPTAIHETGESFVCTGYAHYKGSLAAPLLAVALGMVALAGLRRTRLGAALLLEIMGIGLCAGIFYALFEILVHPFDRVEPLWSETFFNACLLLLGVLSLLAPIVQAALGARSRRHLAA